MTINFNREPYWDDFDESKNFHRVLFRPSVAVQTRELNQLQSILQDQISRFGKHIFKDGSIVLGGQFGVEIDARHVVVSGLEDEDYVELIGKEVIGQTSNLKAYIINGELDENTGNFVYVLRYSSSNENDDRDFVNGEILTADGFGFEPEVESTGPASIFSIDSGVFFFNGIFAAFPAQSIILDKFNSTPSAIVGFDVSEDIVTFIQDPSLLDNAAGSFNFAAPGADRLAIDAKLSKRSINDDGKALENFAQLLVVKDGKIFDSSERSQYSRIYEEIARRTFDQSGDYYVRGLAVRTREHLDTGENEGLVDPTGLSSQEIEQLSNELSIDIEPGLAYVKGFEVNNLVTKHVITNKSTESELVEDQIISARTGGFVRVNEIVGGAILNEGAIIDLIDTAEERVSDGILSNVPPIGTKIGEAKVKSILYASGQLGLPDGTLKVYLYDVKMNQNESFEDVKALHSSESNFFADLILVNNQAVFNETIDNNLLFPIGSEFTKNLRDSDGNPRTNFTFHRTITPTINFNNNGEINITLTGTGEVFPFGVGELSITEKRNLFLAITQNATIPQAGTVSGNETETTVNGSATAFENLNVGDRVLIDANEYRIVSIASNTQMQVFPELATTFSTETYSKEYKIGDLIDLTSKGSDNGDVRSVNITSSTSATINLNERAAAGVTPNATSQFSFTIRQNAAREIKKILRPNRVVKIDCDSLASLTDPIRLGVSNVYKIRQIRKDTSEITDINQGIDVTNAFVFDNGQRDNFYDHSSIIPRATAGLTSSDHLLVVFDYFQPDFSDGDNRGYFSVDSYPIDDTQVSPTTIFTYEIPKYVSSRGREFDLRDTLDFRPVKSPTAIDTTTIASASTNPSNTDDFIESLGGLNIPQANSQIVADYSYYLARRDVITLDQFGNFDVVQGTPGILPVTPVISENVMGIANVFIAPFPSLSGTFGRIVGRTDIACQSKRISEIRHTMREIGVLKKRIENLETVTSLNLLETNAKDLLVLDGDGFDRFKNGFFVDDFANHSLGDTLNLDYKIAIDKGKTELRPYFEMGGFRYQYQSGTNVQVTGDLITLPYVEEVLIDQPRVSTTRNIEQSVFRYIGELEMEPRHDTWIDETTVDKTIDFGEDISDALQASGIPLTNTVWDSWRTISSGSSTSTRTVQNFIPGVQRAIIDTVRRTTTNQERTGTEYQLGFEQQEQEIGNFVTDLAIIPYIRPQIIKIYASGLLANTRFYVYFDGEDMSQFVSPFTPDNTLEESPIFADFDDDTPLQAEGTAIRSDAFGVVYGELRLPAEGKRFRIGTKKIEITDSPTNAIDAVSRAENYFVAQGLEVQKQNTILSTQVPVVEQRDLRQTRTTRQSQVISRRVTCLAYSFFVDVPEEEEGVFLTSVDVFIQSLDPDLGVWFEILEMDSGGGITRTQVPFSEVWMLRDDSRLQTSEDGTVPTNVNFPSPVFLQNNTQYAFVVHTIGINPNTRFWAARLGEEDILTGEPIQSRRLTGTTFTTNNGLNWDIVPDLDLKIRFNRAKFQTNVSGLAKIENKPYEFIRVADETDVFRTIGEKIKSSDILTLSNIQNGSVEVGMTVIGGTSGAEGVVVEIDDDQYVTDAFGFEQGESITVSGESITASISSIANGKGRLRKYNSRTSAMQIEETNGNFFEGMKLKGETSEIECTIDEFTNFPYETLTLKPNYLRFNRTNLGFEVQTRNVANPTVLTSPKKWEPHFSNSFDSEKILLSGTDSSNIVSASMRTLTEYVSPVIDMSRANSIYVHNLINEDITGEDGIGSPNGDPGNLENKYISRIVTLADGQDAEDIKIIITAYAPPGSSIPIWVKARHREDSEAIIDKNWIQLELETGAVSSIANTEDFVEIRYQFSANNLDNDGVFEYTVNGTTFKGFKQFQIKVGLAGTNAARVPRVSDLRAIALQV